MTLTQLFTAIANAIRAVTGKTGTIVAEDFPEEISEIQTGNLSDEEYEEANDDLDDILENTVVPSGTLSITENGTYDVTNYVEADVEVPSFPPDWTQIGYVDTPLSVIDEFNYAKNIYDNWDNTITNRQAAYQQDTKLVIFPLVDTSNVTNMVNIFSGANNLLFVPKLNTENVTNMAGMFLNCNRLEHIPLFDVSSSKNLNNFAVNNPALTNESIDNILQMCSNINSANYIGTKKLSFVITVNNYSTQTIQSLPHYQDFINAGWTIS